MALSRRDVLAAAGRTAALLVAGGALGGCGVLAPSAPPLLDAAGLLAADRFFVAHRGAGDEAPEHTLAAYRNAVERGAAAVEVSVHRTADGVLVCHHDPDLARTCAGHPGVIADMTAAELAGVRVDMRRLLGPAWAPEPIPTLDEVLDRLGGRAVMFIEPKARDAVEGVVDAVARRGLAPMTVYKQHHLSTSGGLARQAGMAVWTYLDDQIRPGDVAALAEGCDALGPIATSVPLRAEHIALVEASVATGKPVIAWALRRREQVDQLAGLGVSGFMCSSWTYLAQPTLQAARDGFSTGHAQPGDLGHPHSPERAPVWHDDGSIGLDSATPQQSLLMGSMCPAGPPPYRLSFRMRFDALPADPAAHAGVVLGQGSDAPWAFRVAGPADGLMVLLRAGGKVEIRRLAPDNGESEPLASITGDPVVAGRWESISVTVAATTTVRRQQDGAAPMTIEGGAGPVGGYFTLTRNFAGEQGGVRFRDVRLSTP
jgi:glycerophosphoryl diester phosphodiesterase